MNNYELNKKLNAWNPEVKEIFAEDIMDYANTGKEGLYFINHNNHRLYVYRGNTEIDTEYCELNRMTIYDLHYGGGPLIGSDIDLSFGFILPSDFNDTQISNLILTKIVSILKKYGLKATVSGNDILVNEKKVAGSFIQQFGNRNVWCIQISFRDYMRHIVKLCTKPMKKIPSFIPSDTLAKEQLKEDIIKIFTKERA